jgi:hypothetical protein
VAVVLWSVVILTIILPLGISGGGGGANFR